MACPRPRRAYLTYRRGPDHIVLYQKNIEAVCSSEAGVREQIRLTVIHELGHYFGMDENQPTEGCLAKFTRIGGYSGWQRRDLLTANV